jgi:CheY-like chemotaxis protein
MKILIVDDSSDSADLLAFVVKMAGHDPEVAYDAQAALETARERQPDVVFLDIGLPEIDGYELARRLRALPGLTNVHLVATTGYGGDDDKQRGREAGVNDHLVKPIESEQVEGLLERLAAARSQGG